ncbi:hypothetical protein N7534_003801 [Penicillium rubens]|nr:hypothetical protein N7534_003801 [Penicillium rubens]
MSEHTVHVNADTAHGTAASTAVAAPVEAWRFVPHRAGPNFTSHDSLSQITLQAINQQVDHEGIPPSAATDARVAEIVARAVQAQSSQDLNARGNMALGSRDHGQGRGNGQGGLLDSTRRAERIRRRGGSGYYAAREAHRTRRRRGSGYYPAREAERARRRRGSGYYPAREAERTRRRGSSGYYAAREAERTRRRRGSAYQPARGRDGRGFVNGVPGHQAPPRARRPSWTAVVDTTSGWSGRNVS